jgi:tetratricopeptide (TPR) repeat protein
MTARQAKRSKTMIGKSSNWMRTITCVALVAVFALSSVSALAAKKDEEKSRYPNATRTAPKNDLTSSADQKTLQAAIDAVNSGDDAKAQEAAQKIVESSKSKYAKGIAYQVMANIKFNAQDYKGAVEDYKKLIELNSVSNDAYFDSMYNIVAAYISDGEYQQAIDELKTWRDQGKRETAESYALEGNAYYRLQKYPEAIAAIKKAQSMTNEPKDSWNSILMASYAESGQAGQASGVIEDQLKKDPTNKSVVHNALVVYTQANEYDKALALLEQEHKQGMITDEKDFVSAAKFYASIGQNSDKPAAAAKGGDLLAEGLSKGAVKASFENYKLMGDAYMIGQQEDKALGAYGKASPMATNGDVDLVRAQILGTQVNWTEAKAVADKAIARGVSKPGKAYLLLGKLSLGAKDVAAAKAAFEKAKQDADTRSDAEAELAKLKGGGKH